MTEEKKFTLEELRQFDGKEGRPAYFAMDGVVFDATNSRLWRNGTHVRKHEAGDDLSAAIMVAPHGKSVADRLPRVGVVATEAPVAAQAAQQEDDLPWFATLFYKLHAHPASVHYPIALCAVTSVLHAVALVIDCPTCSTVAVWNLAIGLLASPAPIVSGLVDWLYQFGGRPTKLFVAKIVLSIVFVLLGAGALAMHFFAGGEPAILYHLLMLSFAPLVMLLGFLGGRITFPN
jgi:predicted heme/steroid binding protein/uncharacterized membrane protein